MNPVSLCLSEKKNSRLIGYFFFFQHCFWWRISVYFYLSSYICNIYFKTDFIIFLLLLISRNLVMMSLHVFYFMFFFFLPVLYWISHNCRIYTLHQVLKVFCPLFFQIFFYTLLFLLEIWLYIYFISWYCPAGHWSCVFFCHFFCALVYIVLTATSSS